MNYKAKDNETNIQCLICGVGELERQPGAQKLKGLFIHYDTLVCPHCQAQAETNKGKLRYTLIPAPYSTIIKPAVGFITPDAAADFGKKARDFLKQRAAIEAQDTSACIPHVELKSNETCLYNLQRPCVLQEARTKQGNVNWVNIAKGPITLTDKRIYIGDRNIPLNKIQSAVLGQRYMLNITRSDRKRELRIPLPDAQRAHLFILALAQQIPEIITPPQLSSQASQQSPSPYRFNATLPIPIPLGKERSIRLPAIVIVIIIALLLLCCCCSITMLGTPTPTPSPFPTSAATITPARTATLAPLDTATTAPTETPAATATTAATDKPTPTSTNTPTAEVDSTSERETARVIRVIDGDTIEVQIGEQTYTVRYIGIDTPETVHPSKPVEWMGPEASAANKELVAGKTVYLEKDVSETDQYGRLLRYVFLEDGTFVNAELVHQGYAQVSTYPPDVKYQEHFLEMQQEAQSAQAGLWQSTPTVMPTETIIPSTATQSPPTATPQPTVAPTQPPPTVAPTQPPPTAAPTQPPAAPGKVEIGYIFYDGVVTRVESDEYAVIRNTGGSPVNLAGWRLNAGDPGQDFIFPGFELQPGAEVRVYTNESHPESGGFSFGSGQAIWANSGDCGYLFDNTGAQVSQYCY